MSDLSNKVSELLDKIAELNNELNCLNFNYNADLQKAKVLADQLKYRLHSAHKQLRDETITQAIQETNL